jgi:acyl-CoA thioesterase-2
MSAVAELLQILDLETLEHNLFRGSQPKASLNRVFGGQVIAQSLVAASRTVDTSDRRPHSLHAYFLIGGDPKIPIVYEVDRIRDGKSFTTRNVKAIQHGQAIFAMSVSFHVEEQAFDHQMQMPDVPMPDQLETDAEIRRNAMNIPENVRRFFERERPIEFKPIDLVRYSGVKIPDGKFRIWIRCKERLPDDPAIHQCVLAYASDMALLDASLIPHGRSVFDKRIMAASLDHALWFHRPFRADEWMLYAQDSPNNFGARGFSRGLLFAADGKLIASVAQEGMTRERREPAA